MPEHSSLAAALCAAQAEMPNAVLDSVNPHFKNRFASLKSLRDASLPPLTNHGLAISHKTVVHETKGFLLLGILLHAKTNETLESEWLLPTAPDKPQTLGSAITYGRRYTWSALVGIAAEEDDDGEHAMGGKTKTPAQAKRDGDYEELVAEIHGMDNTADLRAWGIDLPKRMAEMGVPRSFLDPLRIVYTHRLKELGGNEGPPSTLLEDLKDSLAKEKEDEIHEDVITSDPKAYLDYLDGIMSGAKDIATLDEIWKEHQATEEMLLPADQERAVFIHERHRRQLIADAAIKARQQR